MFKNKLFHVIVIAVLVILFLFLLNFIPEFTIGSFSFRRINIIADILKDHKKPGDSTVKIKPHYIDTCKHGLVCIEDFSPDKSAMDTFFSALSRIKKDKEVVRVAYFW